MLFGGSSSNCSGRRSGIPVATPDVIDPRLRNSQEAATMRPKLLLIAACGTALWFAAAVPARQTDVATNGVDVLTRGPVHEAYAEPTDPRPSATPIVPQQPPGPVPEVPPDVRPEGTNGVWIPGYWAW